MATGGAVGIALGGTAVICCVHNQEKRKVTEMAYDAAHTSLHLCACCENLFCHPSDAEMFCFDCSHPPTFELGGPLPAPKGRI